jgi:hypothetical protein
VQGRARAPTAAAAPTGASDEPATLQVLPRSGVRPASHLWLWLRDLYAAPQQVANANTPGDVMTPLGVLNRTASGTPQARVAAHVVPFMPRTRARSDQYNPEAEHALSPLSHEPDAVEHTAGTLFDCIVPTPDVLQTCKPRITEAGLHPVP